MKIYSTTNQQWLKKQPKKLSNYDISKEKIKKVKSLMKDGWSLLYAASLAGLGHRGVYHLVNLDSEVKELNEKYKKKRFNK